MTFLRIMKILALQKKTVMYNNELKEPGDIKDACYGKIQEFNNKRCHRSVRIFPVKNTSVFNLK